MLDMCHNRTCKEFYQNINKTGSEALPRRVPTRPWESLKSVVRVVNQELAREFEQTKQRFLREHKGDLARTENYYLIILISFVPEASFLKLN